MRGFSEGKSEASKRATNFCLAITSNFFILCCSTFLFIQSFFILSLINRKQIIVIILIPTTNNPYLNNPVRKNVGNPP